MKVSRIISAVLLLGLLAVRLQAQPLVPFRQLVDDFEAYPSTNVLTTVWSNFVGSGTIGLETNIIYEGKQSLRLKYSVGSAPNTNTVICRFAAPQDWSAVNIISFSYGGALGNSTDNLVL